MQNRSPCFTWLESPVGGQLIRSSVPYGVGLGSPIGGSIDRLSSPPMEVNLWGRAKVVGEYTRGLSRLC